MASTDRRREMGTEQPARRIPKLGDIVQSAMEAPVPAGPPSTPYPAIVVAVHDPSSSETLVDIAIFAPYGGGVNYYRALPYSPTVGKGTWSWID
jgi:hypothetical protein